MTRDEARPGSLAAWPTSSAPDPGAPRRDHRDAPRGRPPGRRLPPRRARRRCLVGSRRRRRRAAHRRRHGVRHLLGIEGCHGDDRAPPGGAGAARLRRADRRCLAGICTTRQGGDHRASRADPLGRAGPPADRPAPRGRHRLGPHVRRHRGLDARLGAGDEDRLSRDPTFGWLVGELVRRIDGRPIERILADDVCAPLGIDSLWFGMPESVPAASPGSSSSPAPGRPRRPTTMRSSWSRPLRLAGLGNRPEFARAVVPRGRGGSPTPARWRACTRRSWATASMDDGSFRASASRSRRPSRRTRWTSSWGLPGRRRWATSSVTRRPSRPGCARPSGTPAPGASRPTRIPLTISPSPCARRTCLAQIDRVDDPARRFERELHATLLS